jgi:hypothetical protein
MANKVESADLILKLYDLRREEKMRKAREWFFSFNPQSADEYWQTMMDPEVGSYARMVISYWDMAATMVVQGAIDADLFNETAGEHIMVFSKLEPILGDLRERFQKPERPQKSRKGDHGPARRGRQDQEDSGIHENDPRPDGSPAKRQGRRSRSVDHLSRIRS